MTPAQERIKEAVFERDGFRCIWCGQPATDLDHVIPKSHTSGKHPAWWLWIVENLASLCRLCHEQAHTLEARRKLFAVMQERYHYPYNVDPFRAYLA